MSMERENFRSLEQSDESIEKIRIENAGRMMDEYLNLQSNEKMLFMVDNDPRNTDPALIQALQKQLELRGQAYEVLVAGEETTQEEILAAVNNCDVVWDSWGMDVTDDSVEFDELTELLEETGKRMAWCPGARAESLDEGGAMTENRASLEFRLNKMETKLRDAYGFHVTSSYGTDLKVELRRGERRWCKDSGTIKPGKWDNLPGGEIFTTPDEEKVNGILVLPVLQDEVAPDQGVDEFVRLYIKDGKIRRIDGGASAEKLRQYLLENAPDQDDPESVLQCAEIAFGANPRARTVPKEVNGGWEEIGNPTVETEKRLGTMHLAFGSSQHGEEGTEGHTESDVHLDFVIPRHGLTVEKFVSQADFEKQKNGEKLINEGGWNFV